MEESLEFPYGVKPAALLGGMAFFLPLALLVAYFAATNEDALTVGGVALSVGQTSALIWAIAVGGLLLADLFLLLWLFGRGNHVRLTRSDITLARPGFGKPALTIPLRSITDVRVQHFSGRAIVTVVAPNGPMLLQQALFQAPGDYERLMNALEVRMALQR